MDRAESPSEPGVASDRPGSSKIGMIVPSSNTTMETELPELFRRQTAATGWHYTFHSARARLQNVTVAELAAMVDRAADCSVAISDADVDVISYACLVAVMAQGPGAHEHSEAVLARAAAENGHPAPVTSSAGALVRTLKGMRAKRVAIVTPYLPELTKIVSDYISGAGVEVADVIGLEVADNLKVGRLSQQALARTARRLDLTGVDAVVLSACVQMPSLEVLQSVEDELGVPVVTAATATAYEILRALGHEPAIADAGRLLGVGLRHRALAS